MTKSSAIILIATSFVVGSVVGGLTVAAYYKRVLDRSAITSLASDAGSTVAVLNRLRAGYITNASECLEIELDGDLSCLRAFDSDEVKRDITNTKAIQMAEDTAAGFRVIL